jgi:uncharacterized membrane protein YeaQ/YmgE (transglycosylase-associated protein family)
MGLLMWIIFGAIIGLVADFFDRSVTLSWLERIVIGVVGSVVGGTLYRILTTGSLDLTAANSFDLGSIVISVIGALLSLFVWKRYVRRGVRA